MCCTSTAALLHRTIEPRQQGAARGFVAESVSAVVLYVNAFWLHAPVSTTHTITGAIVGVGSSNSFNAVRWGVAGNSPVSGTYRSREHFMAEAVKPITDQLATPIVPSVRQIVAQGSLVVAYWDGQATAKDGSRYTNSYSWHMQLEDGRITRVTAFLDTWRPGRTDELTRLTAGRSTPSPGR